MADIATSPSKLQRQVAKALDDLGCAHDFETRLPEGLSVDMRLRGEEQRHIVIEVDGPSHYLRRVGAGAADTHAENGTTRFKHRLMRAMGYHVVQVPYFEWGVRSAESRALFMRERIAESTAPASS